MKDSDLGRHSTHSINEGERPLTTLSPFTSIARGNTGQWGDALHSPLGVLWGVRPLLVPLEGPECCKGPGGSEGIYFACSVGLPSTFRFGAWQGGLRYPTLRKGGVSRGLQHAVKRLKSFFH